MAFLDEHVDELCDECRERRTTNPLRTLDCKQPSCQAVLADAPKITDHLCDACGAHFEAVQAHLDARGVSYVLDHRLVRGLDYYMRTAWEFVVDDLGAQGGTIGGGGRYDGLSEQLGGPPAPGIGFGSGIERVLDAMGEAAGSQSEPWTAVAVLDARGGAARPRAARRAARAGRAGSSPRSAGAACAG